MQDNEQRKKLVNMRKHLAQEHVKETHQTINISKQETTSSRKEGSLEHKNSSWSDVTS